MKDEHVALLKQGVDAWNAWFNKDLISGNIKNIRAGP